MSAPQEDKLPPSVRPLWDLVKAGAILCKEVAKTEGEIATGGFVWFLHPGGKRVHKGSAEALVRLGFVETIGDDLFPNDGQTYRPIENRVRNG